MRFLHLECSGHMKSGANLELDWRYANIYNSTVQTNLNISGIIYLNIECHKFEHFSYSMPVKDSDFLR